MTLTHHSRLKLFGNSSLLRVLLAVLVVSSAFVAMLVVFMFSGPSWQLSVSNQPAGAFVVVTKENSDSPIYSIELQGVKIEQPFTKLKREEIQSEDVRTVFYDDTLKPGRWTVTVAGVKLDIMEARLVVDQHLQGLPDVEGDPGDSLTVNANLRPDESHEQ